MSVALRVSLYNSALHPKSLAGPGVMMANESAAGDEVWSDLVITVGKAVIRAEHAAFVTDGLDNDEHVPRIARVAEAVARGARYYGLPTVLAEEASHALIAYGEELFLGEWMSQTDDEEDPEAVLAEGREEFERILAKARGRVAG